MTALKKLCIVASSHNGLEPTAHQIARFFAEEEGWDVTFLDVSGGGDIAQKPNFDLYKKEGLKGILGGRPWFAPHQALSAYCWLKDKNYDAVLFHAPVYAGFFCCQAQRLGLAFEKTALWVVGDVLSLRIRALYGTIAEDPRTEGEFLYLEEQTFSQANGALFTQQDAFDWAKQTMPVLPKNLLYCDAQNIQDWVSALEKGRQTETPALKDCRISVVIEKKSKTLDRCLFMLMSQTKAPHEIIVVGQKEDKKNANILWVESRKKERAERLNEAVDKATGTHLFFIDEDDIVEPDAIELFERACLQSGAALISSVTGWSQRSNDNEIIPVGRQKIRVKIHDESPDYLAIAWVPYGGYLSANLWDNVIGEVMLIEKACFDRCGGFQSKHGPFLMWGFLTRCVCAGQDVSVLPEVLVSFARNKQKYSIFAEDLRKAQLAVVQETLDLLPRTLRPALVGKLAKKLNLLRFKPGETQVQDGCAPSFRDTRLNPFTHPDQRRIANQNPQMALCVSEGYFRPICVMLASIFISTPQIDIHIVTSMSEEWRKKIQDFSARFGRHVNFVMPDFDKLPQLPTSNLWGMGEASTTYLRLCLPALFPQLSRILYMDADILVRHDLMGLWREDLQGLPVGAVVESPFNPWTTSFSHVMATHIGAPYFNGGVMLIDCEKWRQEGLAERVLQECKRLEKESDLYKFSDQGPLNIALRHRWRQLPVTWNFAPCVLDNPASGLDLARIDLAAYQKIAADPAVVHFLGTQKPWDSYHNKTNIFVREYEAYLKMVDAFL